MSQTQNEAHEHCSVRVVLLNSKNEILLMKAEDPSTTETDGTYNGAFWFLIGGQIEASESFEEAALREIYEETGISREKIKLGPVIWYGEFYLILSGVKRHMKQKFVLAHTDALDVSLKGLTDAEKKVVKTIEWFSLDRMRRCTDIIYPVGIIDYLGPIIAGSIPAKPTKIILDRKPNRTLIQGGM